MTREALVFGAIAAVAVLHLTTMAIAYVAWRRQAVDRARGVDAGDAGGIEGVGVETAGLGTGRRAGRDPAGDADGEVVCPRCRTANERGYAYCRDCVAELSTGARPRGVGRGASERPR